MKEKAPIWFIVDLILLFSSATIYSVFLMVSSGSIFAGLLIFTFLIANFVLLFFKKKIGFIMRIISLAISMVFNTFMAFIPVGVFFIPLLMGLGATGGNIESGSELLIIALLIGVFAILVIIALVFILFPVFFIVKYIKNRHLFN